MLFQISRMLNTATLRGRSKGQRWQQPPFRMTRADLEMIGKLRGQDRD